MTAYSLGLIESSWAEELVEKIRVIQADTLSIVQGGYTAGSTTSESSCEAVRLCCNVLVERLSPLKKKLQEQNVSVDWPTLIRQVCFLTILPPNFHIVTVHNFRFSGLVFAITVNLYSLRCHLCRECISMIT